MVRFYFMVTISLFYQASLAKANTSSGIDVNQVIENKRYLYSKFEQQFFVQEDYRLIQDKIAALNQSIAEFAGQDAVKGLAYPIVRPGEWIDKISKNENSKSSLGTITSFFLLPITLPAAIVGTLGGAIEGTIRGIVEKTHDQSRQQFIRQHLLDMLEILILYTKNIRSAFKLQLEEIRLLQPESLSIKGLLKSFISDQNNNEISSLEKFYDRKCFLHIISQISDEHDNFKQFYSQLIVTIQKELNAKGIEHKHIRSLWWEIKEREIYKRRQITSEDKDYLILAIFLLKAKYMGDQINQFLLGENIDVLR